MAPAGYGVQGRASSPSGQTFGARFIADSVQGTALYALAISNSGQNYGVVGQTNSAEGYAAFFTGPDGSRNYFERSVGIGTVNPGVFFLAVNGSAAKPGGGEWSVFSDARLKHDIEPLTGTLDRLLALRGYSFSYNDDAIDQRLALPGTQIGLIAQEVAGVFPDWVETDAQGYLFVTPRGTTALMIESLRELREEQRAEVRNLHEEIARLRSEHAAELGAMNEKLSRMETVMQAMGHLLEGQNR